MSEIRSVPPEGGNWDTPARDRDQTLGQAPGIADDVPDAADLERRHARYQRLLTLAFGVILVLDGVFFVHLFLGSGRALSAGIRWNWLLFAVGQWLWISLGHLLTDGVRLKDATAEHLGSYRREEVEDLVKNLLRPFRDREQPNLYVSNSKEPGAECLDRWLLNFIRPLNAIHITSMLFHLMRPDELRAILAHELGHFYRYTHALRRGDFFVFLFMGLSVAEVGWLIGASGFWGSVVWGSAVYFALLVAFGSSMIHLAKAQEYLADLFGARQTSKLSMVNALLQLGKGLEVSERIFEQTLRRIVDDGRLPATALFEAVGIIDRTLPPRLLEVGEEDPFLDQAFASEEMDKLRRDLGDDDLKAKRAELDVLLERYKNKPGYQILDWHLFDFDIRDLRVNETEYPHLIRRLVEEPDKQLVNVTFDNVKDAGDDEHPTLRQRILFLEKAMP